MSITSVFVLNLGAEAGLSKACLGSGWLGIPVSEA